MSAVEAWFGSAFGSLHPLLQALHRHGGVLAGTVQVSFGRGLAGRLGRRLAASLGVPAAPGDHHLQVSIQSEGGVLHWDRCFDHGREFRSCFEPVGHFPSGVWLERSGALGLVLQVEVAQGGWQWRQRGLRWHGLPLPAWAMPRTLAGKAVEGDAYRFEVEVVMPLLGRLLRYAGTLQLAGGAAQR